MTWEVGISIFIPCLTMVLGGVWWASALNQRSLSFQANTGEKIKELQAQLEKLRSWRHDKASPALQVLWMFHEQQNGRQPDSLISYSDLSDSRVTDDPSKESK